MLVSTYGVYRVTAEPMLKIKEKYRKKKMRNGRNSDETSAGGFPTLQAKIPPDTDGEEHSMFSVRLSKKERKHRRREKEGRSESTSTPDNVGRLSVESSPTIS